MPSKRSLSRGIGRKRTIVSHLASRLSEQATDSLRGAAHWAESKAKAGAHEVEALYERYLHPHIPHRDDLPRLPGLPGLPDLSRLPSLPYLDRIPRLGPAGSGKQPRRVPYSDDFWTVDRAIPRIGRRLLAVFIVLALGFLAFTGIMAYGQHLADSAEVEVLLIRVLDSGPDHLDLEIVVEIDNPAPISIRLEPSQLALWQGDTHVGDVDVPPLYLRPGFSTHTISHRLVEQVPGSMVDVASGMLSGDGEPLTVRGRVETKGLQAMTLDIDKPLDSVGGLSDLNLTIDSIDVDTVDIGIDVTLGVIADNPSKIEVLLDGLGFDVHYGEHLVDTVHPTGWLLRGESRLTFQLFIPAEADHIYDPLVQAVVEGQEALFTVKGQPSNATLLSAMAATFTFEHTLNSEPGNGSGGAGDDNGTQVAVDSILIRQLGLFTTTISINAEVDNPGPVSADLSDFHLKVYEEGRRIGQGSLPGARLRPGVQIINLELEVDTLSLNNLFLLGDLVIGSPIDLRVEVYRNFAGGHALRINIDVTLDEDTSVF